MAAVLEYAFDGLLALALLWLAAALLFSRDLFRAIVLFITFGLLMALAWARLGAPDIALAEAAIGAGLTGALLLAAHARMPADEPDPDRLAGPGPYLAGGLLAVVAGLLAWALLSLPGFSEGLAPAVAASMDRSGVEHPVTAVLLNFRGYDTLLEMFVLYVALLTVWGLEVRTGENHERSPVLDTFAVLLLLALLPVSAYLLWVGAHAPGGAFQAGSVLAAGGVLLMLAGHDVRGLVSRSALTVILVAGAAAFVAIAGLTVLLGGEMLQYPPEYAGTLIFLIEASATVSIGATLSVLFIGVGGARRPAR